MPLYPLKFEPILVPTPWGGTRLASLLGKGARDGAAPHSIGESWELADFDDARSVIANGPHAGKTLQQLIAELGEAVMGGVRLDASTGGFPLLVKFLNSEQPLSIQVHPGPEPHHTNPEARPKNEAWYIIESQPGAWVLRGLDREQSLDEIREAIRTGGLPDLLRQIEVRPGHCHYVPGGTVHTIGPGIVLCEIQTPSRTTYRLHDWDRTDRELHIEDALACMRLAPTDVRENERRSHIAGVFSTVSKLCECEDFRIEKIRMFEGYGQEISYNRPAVWVVLEGQGTISRTPAGIDVPFAKGDVLLMPASLSDAFVEFAENTSWLEVHFPLRLEEQRLA